MVSYELYGNYAVFWCLNFPCNMPWVLSQRDIPAKTQFHILVLQWPCLTLFIYRFVNSLYGAATSWIIHQNLPSFLAGRLCTFVSYIMCFVFAALQQMGFRFSPEFIKFLISKCDLQNHKHMSVDQFIVVCVQIQRFTGKRQIEDVDCSLNISQELVLILGSSTWSAVTANHTSNKIVILCHVLLCAFLSRVRNRRLYLI
jgi:hypothetical protein